MRWRWLLAPGQRRTAGQLLLLAAVLLGVAAMHALGHPAQHPGRETQAAVTHGVAAGLAAVGGHAGAPPTGEASGTGGHQATTPDGHGLDPALVCLAVLAGSVLLLLPLPRRRGLGRALALARRLAHRAPPVAGLAPPRVLSLPELSVLRV